MLRRTEVPCCECGAEVDQACQAHQGWLNAKTREPVPSSKDTFCPTRIEAAEAHANWRKIHIPMTYNVQCNLLTYLAVELSYEATAIRRAIENLGKEPVNSERKGSAVWLHRIARAYETLRGENSQWPFKEEEGLASDSSCETLNPPGPRYL